MKYSIQQELLSHVIATIEDQELDTFEDLHFYAFNEDYYIISYSRALKWLEKHEIDAFEAIEAVIEWEENTLGEVQIKANDINPEKVVNLYVYVMGEELLADYDLDQDRDDLIADLRTDLNED